jgi:hypothetical protein
VLNNVSLYECLFGHSRTYSHLRVSGCLCFVHLPSIECTKLSPQAVKCLFLGYSDEHKGFLCYDPKDDCLRISWHVVFLERVPFYSVRLEHHSLQVLYLLQFPESRTPPPITQVHVHQPKPMPHAAPALDQLLLLAPSPSGNDPPDPPTLRRSSRISVPPDRYGFAVLFTSLETISNSDLLFTCLKNAMLARCDARRIDGEELLTLEANSTWDLVPFPAHASIIGSKWVYSIRASLATLLIESSEVKLILKKEQNINGL